MRECHLQRTVFRLGRFVRFQSQCVSHLGGISVHGCIEVSRAEEQDSIRMLLLHVRVQLRQRIRLRELYCFLCSFFLGLSRWLFLRGSLLRHLFFFLTCHIVVN